MAFTPQLDELNTVTQKMIMPGVADNYFRSGPLMAKLKTRFTRRWNGPQIQENFLYDAPKGAAYARGGNFGPQIRKQTKTGLLFNARYYQISTVEYLEDIEVELAGPQAVFSTVRQDLRESALAMSAMLEIAAMLSQRAHGAVFSTHSLSAIHPPARAFEEDVSGLLAIPLSRTPSDYLIMFRREYRRAIEWAGNPNKPVAVDEKGTEAAAATAVTSDDGSFVVWVDPVIGVQQSAHARERPENPEPQTERRGGARMSDDAHRRDDHSSEYAERRLTVKRRTCPCAGPPIRAPVPSTGPPIQSAQRRSFARGTSLPGGRGLGAPGGLGRRGFRSIPTIRIRTRTL